MDIFKKNTFVRFCFTSASMLQEDLGLPTKKLICLYKECIEMAKHCNDISIMTRSCIQYVLHSNSIGRHVDSLRCLKEILPSAVVIPSYELIVHKYLSLTYAEIKEFDNVFLHAKKWIEIARNIGDKDNEIHGYHVMGNAFLFLACYDDAIDCDKKILQIAQKTDSAEGDMTAYEKEAVVRACFHVGEIYQTLEQYNDAVYYSKKCIDMAQKTGDKSTEARACLCLGEIYQTLEQYNDAVYYSKKCIDMTQETGDKINEAKACLRLLFLYLVLDEKDNAIQYGKKCLDISQETNDKKTQMHGHYLLALVYLHSMQLNDMSLSIDAGMAIATKIGDKEAETEFQTIRSSIYATVGLLDKACGVLSFKELLEVAICSEDDLLENITQAVKTGDKNNKEIAFLRLNLFYCTKKDYEKSINCLEQLKEMEVDRSVKLFCFGEIGKLYQLMGKKDMALRCYKEGLPTAKASCDNIQRSNFYYGFGQLLFSLNKELNLAERYLREAIRCFEAIFTTLGSRDEFKISIFDQHIHSYKLLAMLLITGEQMEEALLVLDCCRARALKDLMISNFKMEQEGSNNEHLEYSDVLSMVSRNDFSISYFSLCFDAFLNFFLGGETNRSFSVCPNHFLQIYVDTLFDEMGVREVVNCENRSLEKEQDIQKEQKRSEEEYEGLNQPTASLLNLDSKRRGSKENSAETEGSTLEDLFRFLECGRILSSKQDEVVIIPEGPLYKVPFPALRDTQTGKYLSETKRIRLAPSLATLKHFEDFPTDRTSNAEPLIIGSPLVGKVMMDGEERDIEPLFGALDEALDIADILGVRPLVLADATKPAVLEKIQQGVSIVHIAAHGILSKATIVLAPSPEIRATKIPDEEDYMLTMAEVQQAQVRAQLVVLSCCHSGRGEIRAEGVVGMCRAFLASGARSVVASLWAIDDDATFEFMQKFYLSLKDGQSASASLQHAMKEMRNITRYSKPKYWAPFFLMGDDVTIKF